MARSLRDVGGGLLLISQFTLLGDLRKGTRPSFHRAAEPEKARLQIAALASALEASGIEVAQGRFGAHMTIDACHDGPVTLLLDSRRRRDGAED
jgi:D-tyrosyl-tRNA(Tyr) deacylase